jgi:hypothetical protein
MNPLNVLYGSTRRGRQQKVFEGGNGTINQEDSAQMGCRKSRAFIRDI